jgi:hypothetical protein
MNYFLVFLSAFSGGILIDLLGWAKSKSPFSAREFLVSSIRSIIGGVVVTGASYFTEFSPYIVISSFLAGAGIDVGTKRLGLKPKS